MRVFMFTPRQGQLWQPATAATATPALCKTSVFAVQRRIERKTREALPSPVLKLVCQEVAGKVGTSGEALPKRYKLSSYLRRQRGASKRKTNLCGEDRTFAGWPIGPVPRRLKCVVSFAQKAAFAGHAKYSVVLGSSTKSTALPNHSLNRSANGGPPSPSHSAVRIILWLGLVVPPLSPG